MEIIPLIISVLSYFVQINISYKKGKYLQCLFYYELDLKHNLFFCKRMIVYLFYLNYNIISQVGLYIEILCHRKFYFI